MARTKVPGPIERRHLVERELTAAQALHYAQAYLEEGLELDALGFLAKSQATSELERLRARAIETGDAFLLRSVAAAMQIPAQATEWQALAESAERAGKQRYAADARRLSERSER